MTAAELSALESHGVWTTDDLDELPESQRHHELIDGVLIVPPAPTNVHQSVIWRLAATLDESCPPEYDVTQGVEIRISRTRSLIPDVVATTVHSAARHSGKFAPHDVVLAVEVISPSSVTMDQITKSALYAQAGIPYYWLVDTDPRIAIRTFRLDPTDGFYQPTGEFGDQVTATEPWKIDFPISRITPRHLGGQPTG
ncbi:MAG TPA: Uma2 family endonuclease [Jatrophihabitantaceae bacterium]